MKAGGECGPRGSPAFFSQPLPLGSVRVPVRGLCGRHGGLRGRGGGGQLGWRLCGGGRSGAAVRPEPRRAEMRPCPLRAGRRCSLRGREPSRASGDGREALSASAGRSPRGETPRSGGGRLRTVRFLRLPDVRLLNRGGLWGSRVQAELGRPQPCAVPTDGWMEALRDFCLLPALFVCCSLLGLVSELVCFSWPMCPGQTPS